MSSYISAQPYVHSRCLWVRTGRSDACAVRVSPSCSMDTCRRACRAPGPTPPCGEGVCVVSVFDDDVSAIAYIPSVTRPGYLLVLASITTIIYDRCIVCSAKLVYSRANVICIRLSNNGATGGDARARRGGHGRAYRGLHGRAMPDRRLRPLRRCGECGGTATKLTDDFGNSR